MSDFELGDRVIKDSGDYTYEGEVVARFVKTSGQVRYVVENHTGMLFIFSPTQLKRVDAR